MDPKVDAEAFNRRLERLYNTWKEKEEEWDKVDAVVVAAGKDEEVYNKTKALQIWLFGYELPDTMMVFCKSAVYFMSTKKRIEFLRPIECKERDDDDLPTVKLLVRQKDDKDSSTFNPLVEALRSSKKGKTIGTFTKDKSVGDLVTIWKSLLDVENFTILDISASFASILAVKEEAELHTMKRACQISSDLFKKYMRNEVMEIVDGDLKVRHLKLADGVEKAISNKKYVVGADMSRLEMCYSPIIQSGGNYSLKFSAETDKNSLHFGVIVCCLGARYKSYCSNIVRTLFVNPTDEMGENYRFLCDVHDEILKLLVPEAKLCDVYKDTISFVKRRNPLFVPKLTKNFGFVTGIEFRDGALMIGPKCTAILAQGMTLNVSVGFSDLKNDNSSDSRGQTYALFIGDTVIVNNDGPATPIVVSKKELKSVAILLKEDHEVVEDEKEDEPLVNEILGRGRRTAVLDSKLRQDHSSEEKRRQEQRELTEQLNKNARLRLAKQKGGKHVEKARKSNVSYKSATQLPVEKEIEQLKIYVDVKYETVILPIFGMPVPFHISTVKNISQSVEGDYTYLRINFFHPGATIGKAESSFTNPEATFVKELTYRSSNLKDRGEIVAASSNLNTAFRLIKEVQKKFKSREEERREKEGLVKQDSLVLSVKSGNPKLKDLSIRPNIVQKKISGSLEAHTNGFRYSSIRGDKVDILYNNIHHAIFQPCESESIILLHFHLKNAIIFGEKKKKQIDVQFFTEVGEITTDLGKHQHMHDRDDLAAEQAERELRHKLTSAFKSFCDKVEVMTKGDIEFDTPFRDLGFIGSHSKSTCLLQPTSGCLINLTEWPSFVISLDEVELVHFERIHFQLKNFDMVFIFKNYSQKVTLVNAIPMQMLDHVKTWLTSSQIPYTEGISSLNWAKIMKHIADDPEEFFAGGGWNFLLPAADVEDGDDDDDDDQDGDETFEAGDTDDTSEGESEDMSEVDEDDEDDDDDASDYKNGSSDESGKDWSDLEAEAAEADKAGHNFEDEYSKRGTASVLHSLHSAYKTRDQAMSASKKRKSSFTSSGGSRNGDGSGSFGKKPDKRRGEPSKGSGQSKRPRK